MAPPGSWSDALRGLQRMFSFNRRWRLRRDSERWPSALADVYDWTVIPTVPEAGHEGTFQVRGTLAITANGERHYGLVYSHGTGQAFAAEWLALAEGIMSLLVRYNPSDPDEMLVIPQQAQLPFELWLS